MGRCNGCGLHSHLVIPQDDNKRYLCPLCYENEIEYRETLEAFQEALALGYSPKEALRDLEDCTESSPKALEEIRSIIKYGI
uniref:DNA helicase RuvA subunit n=1 Tax=Bacillus phage KoopaTroopa TaxID=3234046 RepID=A0AB39C7D6_9CAUD